MASLFTIRFAHFSVADKTCFLVALTCLERDLKSLERGLTMSSYLPKGKSHLRACYECYLQDWAFGQSKFQMGTSKQGPPLDLGLVLQFNSVKP